jgi:protein SCO1/2
MSKFAPYILIAIALVAGFILKDSMFSALDDNRAEKETKQADQRSKIVEQYSTMLIYPKKNLLPDFNLIDHSETQFTNNDFKGYWNFIFSGYTNCPDICPNTLSQMTQIYNQLEPSIRRKTQFVFFSVDPKRDTPEHLTKYLDYFHQDFVGISGETAEIDRLIKSLGGIYSLNTEEGEYYSVDHSGRIFIVGPNAERYGILQGDVINSADKTQLIADISDLVK